MSVSIEDYLSLTTKPYCEFRDGQLTQISPSTKHHSLTQFALLMLLHARGVQPFPALTLRISPSKYLVPDVAVAPPFPGPYPDQPVQLCCEILSPEDRLGSMLGKCEEYHSWGVPYCWVIDPVKRTAWQYEAGGEPFRVTDSLSAGSINIPLLELFANLEEGHE